MGRPSSSGVQSGKDEQAGFRRGELGSDGKASGSGGVGAAANVWATRGPTSPPLAFGPRVNGVSGKADLDVIVEKSLRAAALLDEVKDRLKTSALGMSGGQQQRLCIARMVAVEPEVVLMDEPCSALDPIATARIEELMRELKSRYTIVIVTHDMQQAARVSDRTAFFTVELDSKNDQRTGILVEPSRRANRELHHRPLRMIRPRGHHGSSDIKGGGRKETGILK